jgi:hypothetical protein
LPELFATVLIGKWSKTTASENNTNPLPYSPASRGRTTRIKARGSSMNAITGNSRAASGSLRVGKV